MKKKLRSIMLVDDNPDDNFIHERVIRQADCADCIVVKENGQDALDFLRSKTLHPEAHPELIILDINMPGMNGWEFLEEYHQLSADLKSRAVLLMLTTSNNPDDYKKASGNGNIAAFKIKPLSRKMLGEILEEYFPDYL